MLCPRAAPHAVWRPAGRRGILSGRRLYLINHNGEVQWRRALSLCQASHAVAAMPEAGTGWRSSVSGHVEVYNMEGSLAARFIPWGQGQPGPAGAGS